MGLLDNGAQKRDCKTYLLLREIIGEVGDHDLVLGWNTVSWWATLTTLTRSTVGLWLSLLVLCLLGFLRFGSLGGSLGQGKNVAGRDLRTFLASRLLKISIGACKRDW